MRVRIPRPLLSAIALALLLSGAAVLGGGDVPRGAHGAAEMTWQMKALGELLPSADVAAVPPGVSAAAWASRIPADNAMTPERVELGRRLFFDTRLSSDGTVSCATCHDVSRGFTDRQPVSEGVKGAKGKRNAPTAANAAFLDTFFLDGRAASLEEQAKLPLVNPIEMGLADGAAVTAIVEKDAGYRELFRKAYGRAPNYDDVGRAIAAFERTLIFLKSPLLRFLAGDASALSPSARKGWELYNGRARCATCHPIHGSQPAGSDGRFHNVGVSARHQDFEALAAKALKTLQEKGTSAETIDELALGTDLGELGRFVVTRNRSDIGAFRTTPITNVGLTAPYMHDGSMNTLWDVVDHYNRGGEANPFLDGGVEALALSDAEVDDLVSLLFALTDERFAAQNAEEEARQRALAARERPFREPALSSRERLAFEGRLQKGGK
jgi:cytochrome c peroxidase